MFTQSQCNKQYNHFLITNLLIPFLRKIKKKLDPRNKQFKKLYFQIDDRTVQRYNLPFLKVLEILKKKNGNEKQEDLHSS